MRVSVLMAVCNGEAHVAEAIESSLRQSRPPDEIIVVDDGSDDGTPRVLAQYGDRIVRLSQPNRGQTVALNLALVVAAGDVSGFLDGDDLWCERKLERQLQALEPDTVDAAFGLVR